MKNRAPGKIVLSVLILAAVSAVALYAGGAKQSSAVASVNGVLIPKAYLEREIRRFEQQARSQGQNVGETRKQELNRQALDTLIDMELLYQESQKRGFQVSEERIREQVDNLRSQFDDEEGFSEALEQIGITREELSLEFTRQLAIQDMIDGDIGPSVGVTEQESKGFYEGNPDYFFAPEQVRARHILIQVSPDAGEEEKSAARTRMQDLRDRIAAGEDFGELASQYSEDGSGAYGGDLGYFQREQMVKPFADAAFSLKIGQLSEIVATEYGLHLIEVTDRKEQSVVPFEQVQAQIVEYLHREKVMVAIEDLAAQLRNQAQIEEYPPAEG